MHANYFVRVFFPGVFILTNMLHEQIRALNRAKVQYDNQKWKTIAETMLEYGCDTKWSPHACQLKWQELHPDEGVPALSSKGSWSDNNPAALSSPKQNSSINFSLGNVDGDDDDHNPIILDQAQQMNIRRGTGSKGSGRGRRNIYEQRQDWTVRPQ